MASSKPAKKTSKNKPAAKAAAKPAAKPTRPAASKVKAKPQKPARTATKAARPSTAPAKAKVAKTKAAKPAARPAAKKQLTKAKGVAKKVTNAVARTLKTVSKKAQKVTKSAVTAAPRVSKKVGPKSASPKPSTLRTQAKPMKKMERVEADMPRPQTRAGERKVTRRGTRDAAPAMPPTMSEMPQPVKKVRFKADELRKLRSALETERERLVRDIRALDDQALTDGLAETISQQPGFSLQLADSASDNQQVDTALGIRSIELDQLMQIDEALRSIQEGDYGICHRCGETISLERLLVKPMAKYCVPCRQLLEQGKA
jgi:RNA polymerase-binding protein DksA